MNMQRYFNLPLHIEGQVKAAVHAINCHDELVEVLEAIDGRLPHIADPDAVAETDLEVCLDWRIWSNIKQALAKAKGEK